MCFSATASFGASGLLALMGIMAYRQVRHRNQLLFASIPLLFSIQQAAEGLVWLSFTHLVFEPWRSVFTYSYLFFALVIWPILIPLSVYYLEGARPSRGVAITVGIGTIVSSYLAVGLLYYNVMATVLDGHIRYFLPIGSSNFYISSFLYVCATIVPFFVSRIRYTRFFGVLFALSYVVSYLFYYYVLVSVWCFFAALLSMSVLIFLRHQEWFTIPEREHQQ